MLAKIQKWGNSNGVRIPKHMMDQLLMCADDNVEIQIEGGCITIRPVRRRFLTVEERVADYYGQSYDQLLKEQLRLNNNDFDWEKFEDFNMNASDGGGLW